MITRITKENNELYTKLFQEATEMFDPAELSDLLGGTQENPRNSITSLNEYFSIIEHLKNLDEKIINTDKYPKAIEAMQRKFLRLPVDEDYFEIDANTRAIKVPADFSRNGISVVSDEQAEILYFTIDRYYDMTDLASDSMKIAIQWKVGDQEGLTRNFGKDVQTLPGKIIFGWPIGGALTAAAGNIQFAVRFYSLVEDKLAYSFSTLPAIVQVKSSLGYDIVGKEDTVIDYASDILSRTVSGGIYNLSDEIPGKPTVITKINDGMTQEEYEDIDLVGSTPYELMFEVKPSDASDLTVKWKKNGIDLPSEIRYILDESAEFNEKAIYYTRTGNDISGYEYSLISIANAEAYNDLLEDETELYRKYSVCNLNPAANLSQPATGTYQVEVSARTGINSLTFVNDNNPDSFDTGYVIAPPPVAPTFSEGQAAEHTILNSEGEATLTLTAETDPHEHATTSYVWYEVGNDTSVGSGNSLSLELEGENIDKKYVLKAVTTRNRANSEEITSQECRVTSAPKAPAIYYKVFGRNSFEYQGEATWKTNAVTYTNVSDVVVDTQNLQTDGLKYIWFKVRDFDYTKQEEEVEDEETGETTTEISWQRGAEKDSFLTPVADDASFEDKEIYGAKIRYLIENYHGDLPNGTEDEIIEQLGTIFNFDENNKDDEIIFNSSNYAQIIDFGEDDNDGATPRYKKIPFELPAERAGIYYCIVANKLNEHYNASLGPIIEVK